MKDLDKLLADRYCGAAEAGSILAKLWRTAIADLNITPRKWSRLMENYLDDPTNEIPKSGRMRSTARGNLNKQLINDPMSIKNLLRGLRFLGALRVKFTMELTLPDKTTVHSVNLIIKDHDIEHENDD